MTTYSLIANSGIQLLGLKIELNLQDRYRVWFHEWYDKELGEWKLELLHEITTEDATFLYRKKDLWENGYLVNGDSVIDPGELSAEGILPLKTNDEIAMGTEGEIYSLSLKDKDLQLKAVLSDWLPLPYFFRRTPTKLNFGPLDWSRIKFETEGENAGILKLNALLAFDTRTTYGSKVHDEKGKKIYFEHPVFPDNYANEIDFSLCDNDLMLLDYCSSGKEWSFVDEYLFKLVNPNLGRIGQLKGARKKMLYVASYIFLIDYLVKTRQLPDIKLYKDSDVETHEVDMVVDIGNSKTTALLVEGNSNFNQVMPLSLIDFTRPINGEDKENLMVRTYSEPFDMRLVFRKAGFGNFGRKDSRQFIYPSLVRLGTEANNLIHHAASQEERVDSLSTNSSPKRYLWDWRPNKEEWQFLTLPGETSDHILNLPGISEFLKSDGSFDPSGHGNRSYHYSRRSLMTFSFLEMLVQAHIQLNSIKHRSFEQGLGYKNKPRRIKRIIITCPTAMSKVERETLVKCAKDAVLLFSEFFGIRDGFKGAVEVVPQVNSHRDEDANWYYDEATCSQLVYLYGEVGYKYRGCGNEFFRLYGREDENGRGHALTVGSLDIGAGTSDLMISKYTYQSGDITTVTPEPLFYDSFYYAGDDMLRGLIQNVMLRSENSAFRRELHNLTLPEYHQKIKNFFGPDHNNQTMADRVIRRDFNIQYSIPLMSYFLQLISEGSKDIVVRYSDVFGSSPVNPTLVEAFKERTGIDVTRLEWNFNNREVSSVIEKEFEPHLKQIATIMYAYASDIILLSGRPSSLPPIRKIFLKYYPVSPDRLILLNNYYVGDWYPFSHNTGYITNPKTIVAMGGIIGHYASELSNLNRFVIDLEKLKSGLKSTVNYFEASREGMPISYFITPEKSRGELIISRFPEYLKVRQIGMDTYPERTLYIIDFNRHRIGDMIVRRALTRDNVVIPETKVHAMVNDEIEAMKKRMPFRVTIERDPEDKEKLNILSVEDKDHNEVAESYLDIHIQSLGTDDKYWLDSGAFNL